MFLQVVIATLVVIVVLLWIGRLAQRLMASNKGGTADTAHKLGKQMHEAVGTLLKSGREQFKNSLIGQKMDLKNMAGIALLDLAIKNLDQLNPGLLAKKDLEKLIQEALAMIAKARENAERLGSAEAQSYIEEFTEELRGIAAGLANIESLSETKRQILEIRDHAERIAQAPSFDDAGASEHKKKQDYYEILRINRNATQDDIRKAYHELAKLYHPDKYAQLADDLRAEAGRRFAEMNEAYAVLSNAEKRKKYNQTL